MAEATLEEEKKVTSEDEEEKKEEVPAELQKDGEEFGDDVIVKD